MRRVTARTLDELHDRGVDISAHMDWSRAQRPGRAARRKSAAGPGSNRRSKMLCIHVQPEMAAIDTAEVAALLSSLAVSAGVRQMSIDRGGNDRWINFMFRSDSVAATWATLRTAFERGRLKGALRRSAIVTCEGSRGWSNYKLLHHFDASQPLERLPRRRITP